jgi:putative transcriptional regulator
VVYLCEHSERGALGLVINKPSDINLKNLFDKVELPLRRPELARGPGLPGRPGADRARLRAARGGARRGPRIGLRLDHDHSRRPGDDHLQGRAGAPSTGAGPRKVLVSLGYSAWGEGQLESELAENSWLTVAADPAVIFDTPVEQRYDKALMLLGLRGWMLSPEAGHA